MTLFSGRRNAIAVFGSPLRASRLHDGRISSPLPYPSEMSIRDAPASTALSITSLTATVFTLS
jgi:hypothetical protein